MALAAVRETCEHMAATMQSTGQVDAQQAKNLLLSRRVQIGTIVNMKVSGLSHAPRTAARQNTQSCLFFHRYMTRTMWDAFRDQVTPWDHAQSMILNRMGDIGLVNPSELTLVHIWAVFMVAKHPEGAQIKPDPMEALHRKNQLKDAIALYRRRVPRAPHHGVVADYPADPDNLQSTHPAVYNAAFSVTLPPCPCPIHEGKITAARVAMPCRRSSSLVSTPAVVRQPRGARQLDAAAQQMFAFDRGDAGSIPGLHIYGHPRPTPMGSWMPAVQHMLPAPPTSPSGGVGGGGPDGLPPAAAASPTGASAPAAAASPTGASAPATAAAPTGGGAGAAAAAGAPVASVDEMLEHFGDVIGNGKGKPPMKAAATKQTPMKAMKAKTPMKTKKVISKTTPSPMKANKSKPSPVIVASASALRFPGVPTKPVALWAVSTAMRFYTAVPAMKWRVLRNGQRVDSAFSWKIDARKSWRALVQHVKDGK
ncbi:unnamed protein product [Prorocentrum cordatum]|uniref:Uncharacterized protein n=1 Tax=Prorocentrum cordatum TaxID=2364126 RepID=A0ABN9SR48_9DINO|nr:unnamed protein product [Polarella glacialis]